MPAFLVSPSVRSVCPSGPHQPHGDGAAVPSVVAAGSWEGPGCSVRVFERGDELSLGMEAECCLSRHRVAYSFILLVNIVSLWLLSMPPFLMKNGARGSWCRPRRSKKRGAPPGSWRIASGAAGSRSKRRCLQHQRQPCTPVPTSEI